MTIVVVEIPADVVDKIGAPYVRRRFPANTYTGQTDDVPTAAVVQLPRHARRLKDDIVYAMTKASSTTSTSSPPRTCAGKAIKLKNALAGMPVPLHPGAEHYYKERGVMK